MLGRSSIIALVVACAFAAPSQAQDAAYPTRVVRLLTPWPAGGIVDSGARILAERLSSKLGKNVLVDNRPGASSITGSEMVVRAEPDGYTLLNGSVVNASVYATFQSIPFDLTKDLIPICQTLAVPIFLVTGTDSKYKSFDDLIKDAKAHPGEITYGSPGIGTPGHFAGEMLEQIAKIKLRHIPYKGLPPAEIDAMAGRLALVFDSNAVSQINGGKLRALAVTDTERSKTLPNIATVAEQGYPEYGIASWHGVWAPKGTPQHIVDRLIQTIQEIGREEAFQTKLNNVGADTKIVCGAEFAKYIETEIAKYKLLAKNGGMQLIK